MPPHEPAPGHAFRSILNQSIEADLAGTILADRLEGAHDCQVFVFKVTGFDRAAVNKDRRDIQTRDRDHRARHVLVARADCQQAIDRCGLANSFDGIGNYLARHKGILHSLRSLRDAVAYRDCAKRLRHRLRFSKRFDRTLGQAIQASVARCDGAVSIRDSNDGLFEIRVFKTDGAEHRSIRCSLHPSRNGMTALFEFLRHLVVGFIDQSTLA